MKLTRFISSLFLLGMAAACTTASLEELRQTKPSGDPFQAALAREYLAYAESEAAQYDWRHSKYFADKGLLVAYGNQVQPEKLEGWDLPPERLPELTYARGELINALTAEAVSTQPDLAARTQFLFDCWVEQQEENWQEDDIAACREGFFRGLRVLQGMNAPAATPIPEEPLIFSSSYIMFFAFDSAAITAEGEQIVDTVAEDVSGQTDYEIVLNGHADRSGSVEYNLRLSQRRAEAVKAALVAKGVPEANIRYYAFGESDTRVATGDGKAERANRRVEIFFNQ